MSKTLSVGVFSALGAPVGAKTLSVGVFASGVPSSGDGGASGAGWFLLDSGRLRTVTVYAKIAGIISALKDGSIYQPGLLRNMLRNGDLVPNWRISDYDKWGTYNTLGAATGGVIVGSPLPSAAPNGATVGTKLTTNIAGGVKLLDMTPGEVVYPAGATITVGAWVYCPTQATVIAEVRRVTAAYAYQGKQNATTYTVPAETWTWVTATAASLDAECKPGLNLLRDDDGDMWVTGRTVVPAASLDRAEAHPDEVIVRAMTGGTPKQALALWRLGAAKPLGWFGVTGPGVRERGATPFGELPFIRFITVGNENAYAGTILTETPPAAPWVTITATIRIVNDVTPSAGIMFDWNADGAQRTLLSMSDATPGQWVTRSWTIQRPTAATNTTSEHRLFAVGSYYTLGANKACVVDFAAAAAREATASEIAAAS